MLQNDRWKKCQQNTRIFISSKSTTLRVPYVREPTVLTRERERPTTTTHFGSLGSCAVLEAHLRGRFHILFSGTFHSRQNTSSPSVLLVSSVSFVSKMIDSRPFFQQFEYIIFRLISYWSLLFGRSQPDVERITILSMDEVDKTRIQEQKRERKAAEDIWRTPYRIKSVVI